MANPRKPGDPAGPLSDDDVARMSEQIAGLTAAGLPLGPGLRAAAEEMPRGRLRSALNSVADALDGGATVDEAVAAQGKRLPEHLRGLVLVGSRTGKMSQVLGRFVALVGVGVDLRRQLFISLAYPFLSLALAAGVFVFICSTLVSSFENIFKDFGIPLPWATIALINFSHLFNQGSGLVFEVTIALVVFWVLSFVVLGRSTRRSLLSGIPVLGAVWRNSSLAEFCHLLALLLECEVPLGEAVRLAGGGVLDARIERSSRAMAVDLDGGMTLSQSVWRRPIFPKGLARLLRWAEGHQSLPESLHMVGEMFETRARAQAGFAGTLLAVLAFISVIAGISAVVVGLLVPLITLISKLSG